MERSGIVSDSTHDYRAYGLHIRSAVPLPFALSSESGEIEPDVTVRPDRPCCTSRPSLLHFPTVPARPRSSL